jgi:hypothetical protein
MKKTACTAFILVLVAAVLIGCSAAKQVADYESGYATTTMANNKGAAAEDLSGEPEVERKIIRNAALDLEAKDVKVAYEAILTYAVASGGYETKRVMQRSNGYISIDAQIKIKPEHLDALIEYAAAQGEVINTNISIEDITESYYDVMIRLESMEKSLDRYYDFLKQAKTIDEILSVQSHINQMTVEIESLKGRLKVWNSLLAESVLTLRLRQIDDPIQLKKEINWSALSFADMGYLIKAGLTSVINVLVGLGQWLLIIVIAAAPIWLIALIIILLLRRRAKKRRQAAAELSAARQTAPPDPPNVP